MPPGSPTLTVAAFASVLQIAVVWGDFLPLGIPGKWVWSRVPYTADEVAVTVLNLTLLVAIGIGYLLYVRAGARRIAAATRRNRWLLLGGLTAAGFAWLWGVQESLPRDYDRLGKGLLVLYFPGTSGYYTLARGEADDLPTFLSTYESRMAEGDVLHVGTHPPGLIVLHRAMLAVCRYSPNFSTLVNATMPESARQTAGVVRESAERSGGGLPRSDLAALWAMCVLTQIAAAAAVIPLFLLGRCWTDARTAWWAAALWPLVPGLAVFLPKSDALFPCLACSCWLCLCVPAAPGAMRAAIGGVLLWCGMGLSLVFLSVGCAIGIYSGFAILRTEARARLALVRRWGIAGCVIAVVLGLLIGLVWAATGLNLLAVWQQNLRNHAGFYDVYPRGYWGWLAINPWEAAFAVGAPIAVVSLAAVAGGAWRRPAVAGWATLAVLWLSGKNSGEVARLWLPMLPALLWPLMASGAGASSPDGSIRIADTSDTADSGVENRRTVLLALQLAVSAATVLRVSGFNFEQYAG